MRYSLKPGARTPYWESVRLFYARPHPVTHERADYYDSQNFCAYFLTRASSTSTPSPGPAGTVAWPPAKVSGARTMSSARYWLVRLTPHSSFGIAAARCSTPAVPMLDSATLHARLTLRPSESQSTAA